MRPKNTHVALITMYFMTARAMFVEYLHTFFSKTIKDLLLIPAYINGYLFNIKVQKRKK